MTTQRTGFLLHIHYFRAFAIINIFMVHIWRLPKEYQHSQGVHLINTIRETAFHDSTIYFLFISGFLFFHLSKRFHWLRYYKNKLLHVILPYALFTLAVVVICHHDLILSHDQPAHCCAKYLYWNLTQGTAQMQYWYIPFIAIVFLLSPLFLALPGQAFRTLTLAAAFLPLLGLRTGTCLSFCQYTYFLPVYLIGMYAAMDYDRFLHLIKTHRLLLLGICLTTTILLFYLQHLEGTLPINSFNPLESLFYLQKMSLCALALLALLALEDRGTIPLLDLVATYSFAIFFSHTLIGNSAVNQWFYQHVPAASSALLLPLSLIYVLTLFFLTLLLCMGMKKLLGRHSRYLIGA